MSKKLIDRLNNIDAPKRRRKDRPPTCAVCATYRDFIYLRRDGSCKRCEQRAAELHLTDLPLWRNTQ